MIDSVASWQPWRLAESGVPLLPATPEMWERIRRSFVSPVGVGTSQIRKEVVKLR